MAFRWRVISFGRVFTAPSIFKRSGSGLGGEGVVRVFAGTYVIEIGRLAHDFGTKFAGCRMFAKDNWMDGL